MVQAPGPSADTLAVSLDDVELREELQILVELVIAANDSHTSLTQARIDEVLGLATVHTIAPQRLSPAMPPAPRGGRPAPVRPCSELPEQRNPDAPWRVLDSRNA